ncbi:MAG: diadenylate cyclase [Porphyromonas sp.]|nr:diadenylate cyclase [Porphyromonas sp.]
MGWLPFSFIDLLDIIVVGFLLYYVYDTLRKSGSGSLFIGIVAFLFLWVLTSRVLNMRILGGFMNTLMSASIFILVLLFQDEIRRFLNMLGSTQRWQFLRKIFKPDRDEKETRLSGQVAMLTFACTNMARKKTGALIVIEGETSLDTYIHTGELINADINSRLIEALFFKNSPLHDGAVIIRGFKVVAAGCILPVAQDSEIPKEMGLRHRSGLGMSQQTDARVIVISEERGKISLAYRGELIANADSEQLQKFLSPTFSDLADIGELASATTKL